MKLCVLLILLTISTFSISAQPKKVVENPSPTPFPNEENLRIAEQVKNNIKEAEAQIVYVTEKSGTLFREGLLALQDSRRPEAGKKFDKSLEVFLYSTINVQKNQKLSDCYNQLVETIYRIEFPTNVQQPKIWELSATCGWNISNETADAVVKLVLIPPTETTMTNNTLVSSVQNNSTNTMQGFQTQEFEPSPLNELSKLELTQEEQQVENNPVAQQQYQNIQYATLKGDTWKSISARTGVSVQDLRAANGNVIVPGKKVIIPKGKGVNNVIYSRPTNAATTTTNPVRVIKAQTGDTVTTVAQRYGVTVVDLARFNGLRPTTKLAAGREIRIPNGSANNLLNQITVNSSATQKNLGEKPAQARDGKVKVVIDYLNENLNDPYTMRFVSWLKVIEKKYRGTAYWSVQVKFRAKNSYGAYVLSEWIFYIKANKVIAVEKLF